MYNLKTASLEGIEQQPLTIFTEKAYLDYSMYVILDRALPHLADGLKPVQRRIIYAMSELGLSAVAKHKKSARTVGDVLGKFHPHGDSACYEAMVLMAQSFSYRYPLIDGQGNWGSADDPKSFAAMRYTEAKLSKIAELLLSELGQDTVDWIPNFDGSLEEPKILPARLPMLLLNGTSGIAVGMATDVPPHNLKEVAQACVHLLECPNATVQELCAYIQGPDYPTEAEVITPREEIIKIYETGLGSIRQRAVFKVEHGEIIITALPYQVSGAKVLTQIAEQMQAKKLPQVGDLRDESDHEHPTRLVIVPRSNRIEVEPLMDHLFATTELERSYRVNLNIIGLEGKPHIKSLSVLLNEWLSFRLHTVRRRLQYHLARVAKRLHILEGLLIAFLNIDEVIKIVRNEDQPKPVLIKHFSLTDEQAESILELKLRHLARLEEMQLRAEQTKLEQERKKIESILASEKRLKNLVKDELEKDAKEFGDERRSPLVVRSEAKALSQTELVASDPITVVLSEKGWIRAAKGHEVQGAELSYKAGDGFKAQACGRSNQTLVVLDATGRTYAVLAHQLPSARGFGDPLSSFVDPPAGATFEGVFLGEEQQALLLCSDAGYGFVSHASELLTKNRSGKAIMKLSEGAKPLNLIPVSDAAEERVAIVTTKGHLLVFAAAEIPRMPKGKGQKLIQIPYHKDPKQQERVQQVCIIPPKGTLVVVAGKKKLVLAGKDLDAYLAERASRGLKLPKGFQTEVHLMVE